MKILSLSDITLRHIYNANIRQRYSGIDFVLGCGDLPYYYQEYVISTLDIPLFFVRGNHDKEMEYGFGIQRDAPAGGIDLHLKAVNHKGVLLAGIQGCLRYSNGPFQYTQSEMWWHVFQLVPKMFLNRILFGRYLDIFVTHAPPRGIHDMPDYPHQGIDAFRWLIQHFRPAYHFHGHIHVYRPDTVTETRIGKTVVINTFGYRETEFVIDHQRSVHWTKLLEKK